MSSSRKIRIGIDVGGTFTHAVALDAATRELVGAVRVPTTHRAPEGVARGVIDSLEELLARAGIAAESVIFIAHSTTQATNALLEGDLAPVGILSMGAGMNVRRVKHETDMGDVSVGEGRVRVTHRFVASDRDDFSDALRSAVDEMKAEGAQVIVAAAAFSVDDPALERLGMEAALEAGLPATATHQVSQLYGLRARTRTAAINASLLPKMMEAVRCTEEAIPRAGISAPLMILRSDGGVMNSQEVARRPILTLLSGPAAGVAAALMYVGVADGIFVEVGGTSTDISAIVDGRPRIHSAVVGGHRLYLRTLDVRTIGIAGGSLPRLREGKICAVGPRSAHIAGLPYSAFSPPTALKGLAAHVGSPMPSDPPDYLLLGNAEGGTVAFTTTCAARTIAGQVGEEPARAVGHFLGMSPESVAKTILVVAAAEAAPVVEELALEYKIPRERLSIVGGGGGVDALVPFVAKKLRLPWSLSPHPDVISAIGAALAMIREVVERNVPELSDEAILAIRNEAEVAAIAQGASPAGVEVEVEYEAQWGILRATATAAVEMEAAASEPLGEDELRESARKCLRLGDAASVRLHARSGGLLVFVGESRERRLMGLVTKVRQAVCVLNVRGRPRLVRSRARVITTDAGALSSALSGLGEYGDAGLTFPPMRLIAGGRMANSMGFTSLDQILAYARTELRLTDTETSVIVIVDG